ncbi:MFS general substrate transporter [Setomelanomma holmii]|uniref:MFS general substrate transporter n=1 Tax=Setomelanomma holmii TaxID=210430 RepID=A0A9P4H608_9PLEO|nr:MFS general substrate transporter [Setomelanomma holmii]
MKPPLPTSESDVKASGVQREYLAQDETPEAIESKKKEDALRRKLDRFVAPVMMMLMLISYLDRGNIGFAATQGMTTDIKLKGNELNTAVSVFYIFYILAEFPTSLLVKRLHFNRVIPIITFCWGLVCLCTGFVQNFAGLVTTRIFLGFFEGCLFPSMTLFFCNYYTREELGIRVAYLFIASALSGAFGGLIAFGILYMNGVAGWPGWRWLYVLEGIITIIYAISCIWLVPKDYETAYFLNEEEKQIMRLRAARTQAYSDSAGSGHYGKVDITEAAKDIKSWIHGCIQIAVTRFLPLITMAPIGIAGYAILLSPVSPGVQYFATYLISTACFLCTGGNITWLSANCAPDGKRAASLGILLTLTNIGGVVSGQIYQSNAAPKYILGHAWSLGCLAFAWCGWWIVRAMYKRREKRKDKKIVAGYVMTEGTMYTDREPDFRYQI